MALAFKSAGTVFASGATSTSTFTANVPTGGGAPATGNLLLAVGLDWAGSNVKWNGDSGGAALPTGWSLVRADNDGATGDIGVHVYSKTAGASEANQNFTLSVAENGLMVMLCYSGQDSVTPVDISGATMTDPATATATLTTPVVVTTVANDILLLIYGTGSNTTTGTPAFTTPGSATQRVATTTTNDATNTKQSFMLADIVQAGIGNSAQFSSSSTGNNTATYGAAAIVVAIKAASTSLPPGLGPVVQMEQMFHLDAALMR